ncbi:hypothetical protein [Reyranella sp.]|uniref:hypothetical protein n=1 Tax=Reyranella sp. TaxID=1929291 RepID=UPI003784F8BB
MKSSIIVLVAVMSIVGVAVASLSKRPFDGGKPHMPPIGTAAHPAADRSSEPRPNAVAKSAPAELPKASVEPQQAPVPLLLKPRQAANPPATETSGAPARDEPGTTESSLAPDQAGENAARAAVEADGYKGVRIVSRGDGVWRAKAFRGKTEVLLIVDSNGSVTTAD